MRSIKLVGVVAVVVAGFLWFAIPKAGDDREHSLQQTHLVSQLRILVDIQELFFGAHGTFTSSVDELETAVEWELHESTNLRITAADSTGWAAWAEVIGSEDPLRCHVHVGGAPPAFPQMTEGDPWCETL